MKEELLEIEQRLVVPEAFQGFKLISPGVALKRSAVFTRVKARRLHSLPELKLLPAVKAAALKTGSDPRRRLSLLMDSTTGPFLVITQVWQWRKEKTRENEGKDVEVLVFECVCNYLCGCLI